MADHMARRQRRNRGALLLVALGFGLMVFTVVDADSGNDAVDTTAPATSEPTVLGVVVTRPTTPPPAEPASAAVLDLPDPTTARPRGTTRTTKLPQIGEALTIDNPNPVTTTTTGPSSTTTTEPTTTTTEAPTTTTAP
jgi:hypothetical protein